MIVEIKIFLLKFVLVAWGCLDVEIPEEVHIPEQEQLLLLKAIIHIFRGSYFYSEFVIGDLSINLYSGENWDDIWLLFDFRFVVYSDRNIY